ncbi:MATE family efflux transporter [Parabacteroides bouchesdurhonensis]|uniref:MATE family efflux transporter n=1 Tax=Parabacteroides bouchesdurhonensis TaxID=1936995 RepID=UPI000C83F615|nr:MATE family efflux transporter [Parabacteroides bouchesdurhonensis]
MTNEITWRLEHEKVGRLLLHYAIPAVIGTMVNALYNIVDRIFIGQGVGPLAISGLTLTFPIMLFMQAFGMLVGIGSATRISIFMGRKEMEQAEHVLGNALSLTLLLSLLTIVPSMIFLKDLLLWFGGSEQTIPYAEAYLYIAIPGNLLASLSFSFNSVMRASGYPKKAMAYMLLGAILNVILDPIFIFVFDMGIRGAAIATVISMAVGAAFVLSHFLSKESLIRFHRRYLNFDWKIVLSILAIGISPFSMQLAGSMVSVFLNNALLREGGDLAIGAIGIITSVGMLLIMLIIGIAQGMQPIVGYNYGAGLYQRVHQTLRLVIITATSIMTTGWLCCELFPSFIVRGFTTDPELVTIAANGLRLNLAAFFVVGSQIAISQFFQSIGFAWKAIFLSLSRQVLFLIPAIFVLSSLYGLEGVWLTGPFSDILAALVAWAFLIHHVKNAKKRVVNMNI